MPRYSVDTTVRVIKHLQHNFPKHSNNPLNGTKKNKLRQEGIEPPARRIHVDGNDEL